MTRYDEPEAHPQHPLRGVPQAALDAARRALYEAGYHGDDGTEFHLDQDELTAVAEAVLAAAMPFIRRKHQRDLAHVWSHLLQHMIDEQLPDGTPVLEVVFARNPELRSRLYGAVVRGSHDL